MYTPGASFKILVPKGISRERLNELVHESVPKVLHVTAFKVVSITETTSSAAVADEEDTYRVRILSLLD